MLESHNAPLSSLETPTMISAAGGVPVMAIVEHLTVAECRLRSVTEFAIGKVVAFALAVPGAAQVQLRGAIASCTKVGPRYVYTISLETTAAQTEAIAAALEAARVRAAQHSHDTPTVSGLTRTSVRVPVDCEVSYWEAGSAPKVARATNVSTGGILMNCADQLYVGGSYELRFRLGTDSISVHGRIVAHQDRSPNYNVAFFDIAEDARAAIARFVESRATAKG
jgi:hypothetical protein